MCRKDFQPAGNEKWYPTITKQIVTKFTNIWGGKQLDHGWSNRGRVEAYYAQQKLGDRKGPTVVELRRFTRYNSTSVGGAIFPKNTKN